MKTQQQIKNKLRDLKKEWLHCCGHSRQAVNIKIRLIEWVLDEEPGLIISKPKYNKICETCGKTFPAPTKRRRFCSEYCRVRSYRK